MSVGENIRRLRRTKDYTQEQLASRVGVSQTMIAQIERGTKIPTILLGRDIASVLECTLDDLIA